MSDNNHKGRKTTTLTRTIIKANTLMNLTHVTLLIFLGYFSLVVLIVTTIREFAKQQGLLDEQTGENDVELQEIATPQQDNGQ
jgi:hypothetical protein